LLPHAHRHCTPVSISRGAVRRAGRMVAPASDARARALREAEGGAASRPASPRCPSNAVSVMTPSAICKVIKRCLQCTGPVRCREAAAATHCVLSSTHAIEPSSPVGVRWPGWSRSGSTAASRSRWPVVRFSPIALPDTGQSSSLASCLVHPCVLVADLDGLPALDVADHPSRFKHDPRVGLRRARQAALRYLHAVNEYENVAVFIPVNLANRCFVTHGSAFEFFGFSVEFDGADTRR
jgi:hypothetical protein